MSSIAWLIFLGWQLLFSSSQRSDELFGFGCNKTMPSAAGSSSTGTDCVDDAHGFIKGAGYTCAQIIDLYGCSSTASELAGESTSHGEKSLADACPLSCGRCGDSRTDRCPFKGASLLAGVLGFIFCFLAVVAMIGLLYYRKPAAGKPVSYNDRNAHNHKTTGSLTVVLGESGAGKTTLIHDVHAQCGGGVIVRQYHAIRPGQFVQELPDLDISRLPFEINPGKRVGGSLATGVVIPGLSGGQRKMLIFEIVYQRLLACMEPLRCSWMSHLLASQRIISPFLLILAWR